VWGGGGSTSVAGSGTGKCSPVPRRRVPFRLMRQGFSGSSVAVACPSPRPSVLTRATLQKPAAVREAARSECSEGWQGVTASKGEVLFSRNRAKLAYSMLGG